MNQISKEQSRQVNLRSMKDVVKTGVIPGFKAKLNPCDVARKLRTMAEDRKACDDPLSFVRYKDMACTIDRLLASESVGLPEILGDGDIGVLVDVALMYFEDDLSNKALYQAYLTTIAKLTYRF